jgi:hypothetical protein
MIRKSGYRFSEKNMLKEEASAAMPIQPDRIALCNRRLSQPRCNHLNQNVFGLDLSGIRHIWGDVLVKRRVFCG